MSFWAKDNTDNKVVINNNALPNGYYIDGPYFCPSCRRPLNFVSASSNGRRAHFAGHHELWCDIGYSEASGTSSLQLDISDFSLKGLLDDITQSVRNTTGGAGGTGAGTFGRTVNPKINTVRKLFRFCASNDPDTAIDGVAIKDIYCGMNTRFLYTRYISGLHLVFCDYVRPDTTRHLLRFSYPNAGNSVIDIECHIQDEPLFRECYNLFYLHNRKPTLIFAEFTTHHVVRCEITNINQLIPLKGR